MLDILKEYGFALLQLLLEALLPILVVFVIQWVRMQIKKVIAGLSSDQAALLAEAAKIAVLAAEQMNLAGLIMDKKEWAIEYAQNYLLAHNIPLDLATIEGLIEAAVMAEFNQYPDAIELRG